MEKLMELSALLKELSFMIGGDKPAAQNWIDASREAGVEVPPGVTLSGLHDAVNRQLGIVMRQ